MPPRFRYWTVVIDGVATAFRANETHELIPTLRQLQRQAPGAILMWFESGRLWRSPAEARLALLESRRPARRPMSVSHGLPDRARHGPPAGGATRRRMPVKAGPPPSRGTAPLRRGPAHRHKPAKNKGD